MLSKIWIKMRKENVGTDSVLLNERSDTVI